MGHVVSRFLHHDDNSEIINGKNGEIRKKGQVFRKRALTDTMERLHVKFLREHPRHKLSRAQFCGLKPFWIVRPNVSQRETCACKIHENFQFKIKKLHQLRIVATPSTTEIVESCVCSSSDMECMYRRCIQCQGKTFPTAIDPSTKDNIISWYQWVTRTVKITKKGKDGSLEEINAKNTALEKTHTSIKKLVDLTQEDVNKLTFHVYNIQHQFQRMKPLKGSLTEKEVAIHIDYSENYGCKYTRKVKDTHFGGGNQQVTLHTGVKYLSGGRVESFTSLSASLKHDAVACGLILIQCSSPSGRNIQK